MINLEKGRISVQGGEKGGDMRNLNEQAEKFIERIGFVKKNSEKNDKGESSFFAYLYDRVEVYPPRRDNNSLQDKEQEKGNREGNILLQNK